MQRETKSERCSKLWSELSTNNTIDTGSTQLVDGVTDVVSNVRRTSATSLLVESLIEQLCKLLEPDPVNQRALYQVICSKLHQMKLIDKTYGDEEFGGIRSYYQRELLRFLRTAKSTVINGADNQNGLLQYSSSQLEVPNSLVLHENSLNSRYSTDYIEEGYIAKGGFGEVYKARHRLDGEEYAIKKILLCYRNRNYFLRSLREVKLLARLNHPNIVSYKAAWLEPLCPVRDTGSEERFFRKFSQSEHHSTRDELANNVESEGDSGGIVFRENSSELSDVENSAKCEKSVSLDGIISNRIERRETRSSNSCSSKKALCRFEFNEEISSIQAFERVSNEWATLYIQMQLCESTLRQWLDQRNSKSCDIDIQLSLSIFRQIVTGIQYIHSQGIVHHDIKPSNIFINKDASHIQVGDLGLACIFQHATKDVKFLNRGLWSLDHKGEIGTKLYAAPEQLKGECNPKSDIYSLGVVLFELIRPFSTEMERSKVLSQLRDGIISPELISTHPKLVHLIQSLMATDPALRPAAHDVLTQLDLLMEVSSSAALPPYSITETIRQLRADLSKKDHEIEELKRKVQALESCR